MFWLALAAQLSGPQPIDYSTWFSLDDNPRYLQENRMTLVRAVVRPDGSLKNCEIESSSGDSRLDTYTCALVQKRARYTPARWINGSPTYGIDRMRVLWGPGPPPAPDSTHADV